jgi:hypothetical protein
LTRGSTLMGPPRNPTSPVPPLRGRSCVDPGQPYGWPHPEQDPHAIPNKKAPAHARARSTGPHANAHTPARQNSWLAVTGPGCEPFGCCSGGSGRPHFEHHAHGAVRSTLVRYQTNRAATQFGHRSILDARAVMISATAMNLLLCRARNPTSFGKLRRSWGPAAGVRGQGSGGQGPGAGVRGQGAGEVTGRQERAGVRGAVRGGRRAPDQRRGRGGWGDSRGGCPGMCAGRGRQSPRIPCRPPEWPSRLPRRRPAVPG